MDRFEYKPEYNEEVENLNQKIKSLLWCSYLNGFYSSISCVYEAVKKANDSHIYLSQEEFLKLLEKWQKDAYNDLQKQKAVCEIKDGTIQ